MGGERRMRWVALEEIIETWRPLSSTPRLSVGRLVPVQVISWRPVTLRTLGWMREMTGVREKS